MKLFIINRKQFGLIVLAVAIGLSGCVIETKIPIPSEFTVETADEWISALDQIGGSENKKSYTITINGEIKVQGNSANRNSTFGWAEGITVTLKGSGKLYVASESNGYLINLLGGEQTLIIDSDNLVLEGHSSNNYPLISLGHASDAKMEMKKGTICNNGGGGIKVDDGCTLTMTGGTISGNSADKGGGVYVERATFTMSGGTISGNSADKGGGVYVYGQRTVFNMSGGVISGNTANFSTNKTGLGGGVFVDYVSNAQFNKTGGIIYGSDAENETDKNSARGNSYGHAVCYFYDVGTSGTRFIRDTTLDENTDISTSSPLPTMPLGTTINGWTIY